MHDCCSLHALPGKVLLTFLGWSEYLLKDQSATLLARAYLVNQDLRADIFELITCTRRASFSLSPTGCLILATMALREMSKDFLSILVDAVEEEIFDLNFV